MDLTNKQDLELHFAEHFNTRLFPVLAEHYLEDQDLERAQKVCEIGLSYHPENADGWYILAKTHYDNGNMVETEKCLKKVVKFSRSHLQARIELAEIQALLNRSPNTILASWKKVLRLFPSHEQALAEIERLAKSKPAKPVSVPPPPQAKQGQGNDSPQESEGDKDTDSEAPAVAEDHPEEESNSELKPESEQTADAKEVPEKPPEPEIWDPAAINISPRMATITLARVFKEQGLYYQSLAVLDILAEKGENSESIELERKDVQKRMHEAQKEVEQNS